MTKRSLARKQRDARPDKEKVLFTQHQIEQNVLDFSVYSEIRGPMEAMRHIMMQTLKMAAQNLGVKL